MSHRLWVSIQKWAEYEIYFQWWVWQILKSYVNIFTLLLAIKTNTLQSSLDAEGKRTIDLCCINQDCFRIILTPGQCLLAQTLKKKPRRPRTRLTISKTVKVLQSNVWYQANVEINECAAKRTCTKSIQEKANSAFEGMNEMKKNFLTNWIKQTYNMNVGWNCIGYIDVGDRFWWHWS